MQSLQDSYDLYCGSLDYSAHSHSVHSIDKASTVFEHMRKVCCEPSRILAVRQINLSCCCLGDLWDPDFKEVLDLLSRMACLEIAKLQRCGLGDDKLCTALLRILQLPHMQREPSDRPHVLGTARAEISLDDCQCTDELFTKLSDNGCCKAHGLAKLSLMYNDLSDRAVVLVANLAPNLQEIYLNGNKRIVGEELGSVLAENLASLGLLSLDCTGITKNGVAALEQALKRRKGRELGHIEIRMRCLESCAMQHVVNLAEAIKENKLSASLKHDLQRGFGYDKPTLIKTHDELFVRLRLNLRKPLLIKEHDISACVGVWDIAEIAKNELEACCLNNSPGKLPNPLAQKRRMRYSAALCTIIEEDQLHRKKFTVATVSFWQHNQFNGHVKSLSATKTDVLGAPAVGFYLSIDVALEEDYGSEYLISNHSIVMKRKRK